MRGRARIVADERLLDRLELGAVLLLLLAALVPRSRDLGATFDRDFEGFQGAFFAIAAVNYERLGFDAFGGYPVINVEPDAEAPERWYVYPNHSPLVPWLAWGSAKLFGPDGWDGAWREARAPERLEPAIRLPFFLLHLLGLLALWWAVRQTGRRVAALLALALAAALPLSIVYATLANYENPSLPFVLLGFGFHARLLRGAPGRNLLGLAASFAAATAMTFGPAFFLVPLVLHGLARSGAGLALREALAGGGAALVPIALHGVASRAALGSVGRSSDSLAQRARLLWEPLLDGSQPLSEWLALQGERAALYFSWPYVVAAVAGVAVALARAARRRSEAPPSLGLPLAAGGALMLLGYYRHTFDAQTPFLLNLAPGVAVLGAEALEALARPLWRLRAGVAPLVVATSLVAIPGLLRAGELRRAWRAPGPNDDPPGELGPRTPLPATSGRELAELLPPRAAALYPAELGFNTATFYYAWRTLVPFTRATLGGAIRQLDDFRAAEAERFWVLPKRPPPAARAAVRDLRATLQEELGPPELASDAWEAWRIVE